ncbi:hypothetical protein A3C18_00130 [Candidatus Kaiserbacteria bacterium RIFCSPHIGHO2_02_FULL_54_11b]|uniref:PsbP C-terminal domain-containing protein n=1 Tax=Candidatus Kaiserbacteria bacterium RIFCSPHIGHO2_02_FULL_54_11b TaxID=1798494 RepID=A0A1F6DTC6_9BACT|nr:MAG: hypothetical protein A3C18_00130 [Candidatus Kaiserbacteria bacterium RIFCSPHIGHO2_02_FULL_54_11b]
MRKTITLAIVVVALVLGLYVAFIPREEAAVNAVAPKDWKEYSNDSLGVRFFSPTRLTVAQNGSYSVTISDASAQTAEFYYVSVVPSTLLDTNEAEVYNYQKAFHQKLLGLAVGEKANLADVANLAEWYTYVRQPDTVVNGRTARVFLNQNPWEFPAGTREYRYVFELRNKTVLVGGYFTDTQVPTRLNLAEFEQIVSSMVITD